MQRQVIGLTGCMASGKDLAADFLRRDWGLAVIDVDRVGHLMLDLLSAEVRDTFGAALFQPAGREAQGHPSIDRAALGRIVFSDPAALARLESILHPAIYREVGRILQADTSPGCLINAAILYRMGLDRLCDQILFIDAPQELLVERIMQRNQLTREAALQRLALQEDVNRSRESADRVIENAGSPEDFLSRVRAFAQISFGSNDNGDATIAVRSAGRTQEGPVYP